MVRQTERHVPDESPCLAPFKGSGPEWNGRRDGIGLCWAGFLYGKVKIGIGARFCDRSEEKEGVVLKWIQPVESGCLFSWDNKLGKLEHK